MGADLSLLRYSGSPNPHQVFTKPLQSPTMKLSVSSSIQVYHWFLCAIETKTEAMMMMTMIMIYIMMKCMFVCHEKSSLPTSEPRRDKKNFRSERHRREVSRPLGLAGQLPALA